MINLAKKRKYVIQQTKDEIFSMCENLKKEKVTDKQLLYLINMVIIPRIEYHTQLTFLSKQDCNDIISFRKLFKMNQTALINRCLAPIFCLFIKIILKLIKIKF
ncbi:hypothetical protein RhiirC2_783799 [Rhizophagus irregularis]|uniref:Uncharacterized protein n=1 Tax=Rhizophagus irregularis TaxID=588596 RepID=A0A2N1MZZ5_9GLOM|nr:hypothetical protein RhiirC2_783799 [Rhizophagus irregularis]